MFKNIRFLIVALLLLMWAMPAPQYECVTPDCPNFCSEDGDLCPDCKEWLDALDPADVLKRLAQGSNT